MGEVVEYPAAKLVTKTASCARTELSETIGRLFGEMCSANPGMAVAGSPRIYYVEWGETECTLMAGMPVAGDLEAGPGTEVKEMTGGQAFKKTYLGPYTGLAQAWQDAWTEISAKGLQVAGPTWDDYVTDPGGEPDQSKWQTDIYLTVA
jgi:effector-binding domain-containing protein